MIASYQSDRRQYPRRKKKPSNAQYVPGAPSVQPNPPQAPTAPPQATLGGDAGVLGSEDSALRQQQLAQAQYQYTTGQNQTAFGYDQLGQVDLNNPYSEAALALEFYKRNLRGTTNAMAARGQTYTGAGRRANDEVNRNYAITDDRLRKRYQGAQQQALGTLLSQYGQSFAGMSQADYEALLRALKGGS